MRISTLSVTTAGIALLTGLSDGWAATRVSLPFTRLASLQIVYLLGDAPETTGIQVTGYHPGVAVTSARCKARVSRPSPHENGITHPSNRFECVFTQAGFSEAGSIRIDLARQEIRAFGNIAEKTPFSIHGNISESLFEILEKKVLSLPQHPETGQPENPMYSELSMCTPDGSLCKDSFFLNQRPDLFSGPYDFAPGQLACERTVAVSGDTRKVLDVKCVFLQ